MAIMGGEKNKPKELGGIYFIFPFKNIDFFFVLNSIRMHASNWSLPGQKKQRNTNSIAMMIRSQVSMEAW